MSTARRLLGRGTGGQGKPTSAQSVRRLLREKETRFTTLAKGTRVHAPWPGLLRTLLRRKIPLALVTGTSRAEVQRVVPRPILALFDVVITGDAVRHGKPHPESYRTACRRLRVPACRTVVIENAPYGIRSARLARIGWIVALTSSLPSAYLHEADAIVHSSRQLRIALYQALAQPLFPR